MHLTRFSRISSPKLFTFPALSSDIWLSLFYPVIKLFPEMTYLLTAASQMRKWKSIQEVQYRLFLETVFQEIFIDWVKTFWIHNVFRRQLYMLNLISLQVPSKRTCLAFLIQISHCISHVISGLFQTPVWTCQMSCQLWIRWPKSRQDLRGLGTGPSRSSQFTSELSCWILLLRLIS